MTCLNLAIILNLFSELLICCFLLLTLWHVFENFAVCVRVCLHTSCVFPSFYLTIKNSNIQMLHIVWLQVLDLTTYRCSWSFWKLDIHVINYNVSIIFVLTPCKWFGRIQSMSFIIKLVLYLSWHHVNGFREHNQCLFSIYIYQCRK